MRFAGVEHRQYVRVIQLRRDTDLAQEPIGADAGGELGPKDLDRDTAIMALVVREMNDRHSSRADHAQERVAARERGFQLFLRIRHNCPVAWATNNTAGSRIRKDARAASGPRQPPLPPQPLTRPMSRAHPPWTMRDE